jgi:hypothetical protein
MAHYRSMLLKYLFFAATLLQFATAFAPSAHAINDNVFKSVLRALGTGNCEGAAFTLKISSTESLSPKQVVEAARKAQEVFSTIALIDRMQIEYSDYKLYKNALLKIIAESKQLLKNSSRVLPTIVDYQFNSKGVVQIKIKEMNVLLILDHLEAKIKKERRVGYFPMLAREIILLNTFANGYHSVVSENNQKLFYTDELKSTANIHLLQLEAGVLPFPFPDYFNETDMALLFPLGVVPLGIASKMDIYYDDSISYTRLEFINHDDMHFENIIAFFNNPNRKKLVEVIVKFYLNLAKVKTSQDRQLLRFIWGYLTHETTFLVEANGRDRFATTQDWLSFIENNGNSILLRIDVRTKNKKDQYSSLPPYMRTMIDTGQDKLYIKELARGMKLFEELLKDTIFSM